MKTCPILSLALLFCFALLPLAAQVPGLLNYQGRIAVGSTNFDGNGQFKFALVNGTGSISYWSNDGTSTAGSQPAAAVTLPVVKGLYSVQLGDTTLANMTTLPATVFANADVRLRVWFNDGTTGFQLLTPDKRIAAVGYAMMAGTVVDGAITAAKLASEAVTSEKIAGGAVGSVQMAPGAATANLAAGGQAPVPVGGLVLSQNYDDTNLVELGYANLGKVDLPGVFEQRASSGALLTNRSDHTAVWTGTEMIVWGGWNGVTRLGNGARYNPKTNTWTAVSNTNAPTARSHHTAVWTGSEMIIWGGYNSVVTNTGGRYNPATNTWSEITSTDSPTARYYHTAVWTGSEMIIWGGYDGTRLGNGARYNPVTDTWTALNVSGGPAARYLHTAVWTGSEMIVWGGGDYSGVYYNNGGRYDPSANSWTNIPAGPGGRYEHVAVWTGSEMIVWGGYASGGTYLNAGGRFNPVTGLWTSTPLSPPVSPLLGRSLPSAVWDGTGMIIWGGFNGSYLNNGAIFSPADNAWRTIVSSISPTGRILHSTVWTGKEMVVWGGIGPSNQYLGDLINYSPPRVVYLYQKLQP